MAHATDYASHTHETIISDKRAHAKILVSNFIRENPTWSIDSMYTYCMRQYEQFGITQKIFADCARDYVMSRT